MSELRNNLILTAMLAALVGGCSADFGFEKTSAVAENDVEEPCDCLEPHPSPEPSPRPKPPGEKPPCPKPPPSLACTLGVFVHVAQVRINRAPGAKQTVEITAGEVDLCALSKDFFGTLNRALSPTWLPGDSFSKIDFVLSERTGANRVESAGGEPICSLRLPPGPAAGLRFEAVGRDPVRVDTGRRITFDFNEQDALHTLGGGLCQLKHPVGHYDLK
ncbi:MAG TPA: hypothetical protein VFV50_14280 [Bdellovibrionales bacterium]|nr:hypothetical protein [Bdellovibrionales bacterium]